MTVGDDRKLELYAFTPEKKIAKVFEETRNLDLFIKKIIYMDKEDYSSFFNRNSQYVLEYHIFTHKIINEENRFSTEPVSILCTTKESDVVIYTGEYLFSDYLIESGGIDEPNDNFSVELFLPKYREAMRKLFVDDILCTFTPLDEVYFEVLEMSYDNLFQFDSLSLFVYKYGNLFKKEGMNK